MYTSVYVCMCVCVCVYVCMCMCVRNAQDPRFNQTVDRETGYRTRTMLCMPIRDNYGNVVAVVQVCWRPVVIIGVLRARVCVCVCCDTCMYSCVCVCVCVHTRRSTPSDDSHVGGAFAHAHFINALVCVRRPSTSWTATLPSLMSCC